MHSSAYYPTPQGPRQPVNPRLEEEGNVILCMVDSMMYPITEETLDTVLRHYGEVVERVIFERPKLWQAVVQYSTASDANSARQALEGHGIYEGGYNKLRVFSSTKHALAYAKAAIASPEYRLSEEEAAAVRAVVNGDDYVRAHSDIGRGAAAALCAHSLPPCFVPTSIPPVAGAQPSVAPVPVGGPQVYVRPTDPYMNGPPPGAYATPAMTSAAYHPQMQPQPSFQRRMEMRYPRPVPMTTYQQHPMPHPMQQQPLASRNSHGPGMLSGGMDRPKQV